MHDHSEKEVDPGEPDKADVQFSALCKLRDQVAHANYYAETPTKALKVCSGVKTIMQIQQLLASAVNET